MRQWRWAFPFFFVPNFRATAKAWIYRRFGRICRREKKTDWSLKQRPLFGDVHNQASFYLLEISSPNLSSVRRRSSNLLGLARFNFLKIHNTQRIDDEVSYWHRNEILISISTKFAHNKIRVELTNSEVLMQALPLANWHRYLTTFCPCPPFASFLFPDFARGVFSRNFWVRQPPIDTQLQRNTLSAVKRMMVERGKRWWLKYILQKVQGKWHYSALKLLSGNRSWQKEFRWGGRRGRAARGRRSSSRSSTRRRRRRQRLFIAWFSLSRILSTTLLRIASCCGRLQYCREELANFLHWLSSWRGKEGGVGRLWLERERRADWLPHSETAAAENDFFFATTKERQQQLLAWLAMSVSAFILRRRPGGSGLCLKTPFSLPPLLHGPFLH